MAYSRSALAFTLLLTACPGGGGSSSSGDTGTGTTAGPVGSDSSNDPCPMGSPCGNECVFLGSDPNNCGACGIVCPEGVDCIAAQCLDTNPCDEVGGYPCNGGCVDLDNDPNNCGDCENVCEEQDVCNKGDCIPPGGESSGPPPDTDTAPGTSSDGGSTSTSGATTSGSSSTGAM